MKSSIWWHSYKIDLIFFFLIILFIVLTFYLINIIVSLILGESKKKYEYEQKLKEDLENIIFLKTRELLDIHKNFLNNQINNRIAINSMLLAHETQILKSFDFSIKKFHEIVYSQNLEYKKLINDFESELFLLMQKRDEKIVFCIIKFIENKQKIFINFFEELNVIFEKNPKIQQLISNFNEKIEIEKNNLFNSLSANSLKKENKVLTENITNLMFEHFLNKEKELKFFEKLQREEINDFIQKEKQTRAFIILKFKEMEHINSIETINKKIEDDFNKFFDDLVKCLKEYLEKKDNEK